MNGKLGSVVVKRVPFEPSPFLLSPVRPCVRVRASVEGGGAQRVGEKEREMWGDQPKSRDVCRVARARFASVSLDDPLFNRYYLPRSNFFLFFSTAPSRLSGVSKCRPPRDGLKRVLKRARNTIKERMTAAGPERTR